MAPLYCLRSSWITCKYKLFTTRTYFFVFVLFFSFMCVFDRFLCVLNKTAELAHLKETSHSGLCVPSNSPTLLFKLLAPSKKFCNFGREDNAFLFQHELKICLLFHPIFTALWPILETKYCLITQFSHLLFALNS